MTWQTGCMGPVNYRHNLTANSPRYSHHNTNTSPTTVTLYGYCSQALQLATPFSPASQPHANRLHWPGKLPAQFNYHFPEIPTTTRKKAPTTATVYLHRSQVLQAMILPSCKARANRAHLLFISALACSVAMVFLPCPPLLPYGSQPPALRSRTARTRVVYPFVADPKP